MMIIRRKEDNNFWNILIIHKRVKMYTGKKNAGIKTHIYSDFILPHWPKKVILKLRLFSKKNIEKNNVMMMMMMSIETNFQFPKSFKKIKQTKQKKINRWSFFFFCKIFARIYVMIYDNNFSII